MKKSIEFIKSKIFDQYDKDPPLDNDIIKKFSDTLNLPEDYIYWMQWANGGEGRFGDVYFSFWPIDELEALNKDFSINKYLGNRSLCFGTNGGGLGYVFKSLPADSSVWAVPLGDLDWSSAVQVGSTFSEALLNAIEGKFSVS